MKNREIGLFLFLLGMSISMFAQTGIGTQTPDENSVLDISSSTKGVLIPRLTATEVATLAGKSPTEGMLVYNVDEDCVQIYIGAVFQCMIVGSGYDNTKDAWIDDNVNAQIKLGSKSDGATARTTGTEFVATDDGKVGVYTSNPRTTFELRSQNATGTEVANDVASTDGILVPRVKRLNTNGMINGQLVYLTEDYTNTGGTSTVVHKEGFYYWKTDKWYSVDTTNDLDLSEGGRLLAIDGKVKVAQELAVLMTADQTIAKGSYTAKIKHLSNEIIDNRGAFTGDASGNSFAPEATGIYQILINVLCSLEGITSRPVVGLWDDTADHWVARMNPHLQANRGEIITLVTAISLNASHTYSFRAAPHPNYDFKLYWQSSGATGFGPASYFFISRIR